MSASRIAYVALQSTSKIPDEYVPITGVADGCISPLGSTGTDLPRLLDEIDFPRVHTPTIPVGEWTPRRS